MLGIFLDTETNGLNSRKHKVLEIAFKMMDVYTGELKETFHSLVSLERADFEKSDPESLKINEFTWEEIEHAPPPFVVGEQIQALFAKHGIQRQQAIFICQNPSFDRVYFAQLIDADVQEKLLWPYHWLDLASMYWSRSIGRAIPGHFPWETGCSKDKIAAACGLPREGKPHRAMNGVNHLILCYESVVGFPHKRSNRPLV